MLPRFETVDEREKRSRIEEVKKKTQIYAKAESLGIRENRL